MESYEDLISYDSESGYDDCRNCPYKGEACNNQCTEIQDHINPSLEKYLRK